MNVIEDIIATQPEELIIAINLFLLLFAYFIIYPKHVKGDENKLVYFESALTIFSIGICAALFWNRGIEFDALFTTVNWFWFCLGIFFIIEIPLVIWYCVKYNIWLELEPDPILDSNSLYPSDLISEYTRARLEWSEQFICEDNSPATQLFEFGLANIENGDTAGGVDYLYQAAKADPVNYNGLYALRLFVKDQLHFGFKDEDFKSLSNSSRYFFIFFCFIGGISLLFYRKLNDLLPQFELSQIIIGIPLILIASIFLYGNTITNIKIFFSKYSGYVLTSSEKYLVPFALALFLQFFVISYFWLMNYSESLVLAMSAIGVLLLLVPETVALNGSIRPIFSTFFGIMFITSYGAMGAIYFTEYHEIGEYMLLGALVLGTIMVPIAVRNSGD